MFNPFHEPVAIFLTIMAVILITPIISRRVRLPGVVGLILGGLLVGPHELGILSLSHTIELLGTVGLVYLMFSAGLEINLRQFARVRNKALVFGVLTFLIPQIAVTFIGRALNMSWLSAILLGSTFASHTLIAYPILSRLGVVRNEALSVAVGATVFTDVASLLVLAVVANVAATGGVTPLSILRLVGFMVVYTLIILLGLPRLGKLFFRMFSGRDLEFQFVLVALFAAAELSELVGMHAIVGAFLAGLAINATLPERSAVASQTLFLGNSFFIPMFMIYVGMSIDPAAFFTDGRTLLIGVVLTLAVYATKFAATWITARLYRFGPNELMTFWGLSQAQAAATIATILIGVEFDLFDMGIFNGAILTVLITCITSPILVERFGRHIATPPPVVDRKPIFNRILVPIANPETEEHLLTLSSVLCHGSGGCLMPLNVAIEKNGRTEGLVEQRRLLDRIPEIIENPEIPIEPVIRVGHSVGTAIRRASVETDATLIVMGWHGKPSLEGQVFGTVLDHVFWTAEVPVMVARITTPINSVERILFVVPSGSLHTSLIDETLTVVLNIAQALKTPLHIMTAPPYAALIRDDLERATVELVTSIELITDSLVGRVSRLAKPSDLLIVPTVGSRRRFSSSLGHVPEDLAHSTGSSILVIHW